MTKRKQPRKTQPPVQSKNTTTRRTTVVQHSEARLFSGPIPPPETLGKYEKITPGLAERIISMAEKQGSHRQSLESKVVESDIGIRKRGQIFAFILGILAMACATFLIFNGRNVQGFVILVGSFGTLITAFMYGSHTRSKERKAKNKIFENTKKPNP